MSQSYADDNAQIRKLAEWLGLRHFRNTELGISHQMMLDYGYVRP